MSPSKKDQRAEDQDAAIEQAFVAGTLPEEDRRAEGAEVQHPDIAADAGQLLHRDNATSPGHVNGGNHG
jgi:hypothetical protein